MVHREFFRSTCLLGQIPGGGKHAPHRWADIHCTAFYVCVEHCRPEVAWSVAIHSVWGGMKEGPLPLHIP